MVGAVAKYHQSTSKRDSASRRSYTSHQVKYLVVSLWLVLLRAVLLWLVAVLDWVGGWLVLVLWLVLWLVGIVLRSLRLVLVLWLLRLLWVVLWCLWRLWLLY